MNVTLYQEINKLLTNLLFKMQNILGEKLVGLYLYGSLASGDFDLNVSDIDLVTVLKSDINDEEFRKLQKMHQDFVNEHKEWDDRIEVRYISVTALQKVKSYKGNVVNISPGEPFHITEVRKHWIMDWYMLQEKGITFFGPSPKNIIEPISKEDFIQAIKENINLWHEWINTMYNLYAQSYAILTMCRSLYAYRNGEQISKKQSAIWAEKELPQWSSLIQKALTWREDPKNKQANDEEAYQQTKRFVNFVVDLIIK